MPSRPDNLKRLAEEQPHALIAHVHNTSLSLGLRAAAVDAFQYLAPPEKLIRESIRAFETGNIILQEAALGVLLEAREHTDAAAFILQIAADTTQDRLIIELANEMKEEFLDE